MLYEVITNGDVVENADHVSKIVDESEGVLNVVVEREGRTLHLSVTPVADSKDGKMRLGVWVRDSTAGVGTLTFIDP